MLTLSAIGAAGQNIQLHYDFERECATATVEMFRPDKIGSTYFFVDMDFNPKMTGAYFEIARELCFWQKSKLNWLSIHAEYNGGLDNIAGSYNNAWLGGLTYSGHSKDYTKTWSLSAMYKAIPGARNASGHSRVNSFQITGVWGVLFAKGWLSFDGFFDFWREDRPWQNTRLIFMAEPQLWVNLNRIPGWKDVNLSIGSEVELSHNFVGKGFHACPTIGAKWTFK